MSVCCVIFAVFPNGFDHRPLTFEASPLQTYLLNFIYSSDKAMNVFPSIHVYNSIVCAVALLKCKEFKGKHWMTFLAITSAVLISLSTMFIKQHSILDVLAACILALVIYPLFYRRKK